MTPKEMLEELAAIEAEMARETNNMSMVERVRAAIRDAMWPNDYEAEELERAARAAIEAMERTEAERIVALLGELGIKRTEITAQYMEAVHAFLVDAVLKDKRKP